MQRHWLKALFLLSREARPWQAKRDRQKIGLILISLGLFFFLAAFSFKFYQESRRNILSFSHAPEITEEIDESDLPERIIISQVGIDLPVFPAKVADNQWEISEEGAFYLLGSGIPGKEGNVVIYGHNKNSLLGPIRWLEKEAEIKIISQKGKEFVYKIGEIRTVSPKSIGVLAATREPILTLYTCTGFLDSQRFVVRAKLQPE